MKDAWRVKAEANGGRQMRATIDDQNFDNYSVGYTFADGTTFFYVGRTIRSGWTSWKPSWRTHPTTRPSAARRRAL
jgi:hypothetical protein